MRTSADLTAFVPEWRAAVRRMLLPATVLVAAWSLYNVPGAIHDGTRGGALVVEMVFGPLLAATLLVAFAAAVRARRLDGTVRTWALAAAAVLAAMLASIVDVSVMIASRMWPAPPWSGSVTWWANFGTGAMICVGAALVDDYRVRSADRAAALRDARLHAADVVRRTAEVRLQAARARLEPRFLFDALTAVERVYGSDARAGGALLDDLVSYLRAVIPDLHDAARDPQREAAIAGMRRAIEDAVAGGGRA